LQSKRPHHGNDRSPRHRRTRIQGNAWTISPGRHAIITPNAFAGRLDRLWRWVHRERNPISLSFHNGVQHGLCTLSAEAFMAKYGKAASRTVKSAMHRRKKGTLKSGSGGRVKSRKQAIAMGLSEAREKGAKVPRKSSRKRSGGSRKKS